MKTRNNAMHKLILAAMFAALSAVAAMVIQIPVATGYVNLSDAVVLLGAFVLGPVYGFVAGGLGPALADLLLGWGSYAPGTFVIKGCEVLLACLLLSLFYKKGQVSSLPRLLVCTVPAGVCMALGYFLYETVVLKLGGGAVASLPFNLIQGLIGAVASVVLFRLLRRAPALRERFWKG